MTYLQFHFVFILPLILLLGLRTWLAARRGEPLAGALGGSNRFALGVIAVHMFIALVYTTPWDNYLVYRNVWGYPEGRVMFTIGYVPFEEYLFFLLQTLLTGLWYLSVGRIFAARQFRGVGDRSTLNPKLIRGGGVIFALLLAAVGLIALSYERGTYLGLILVWAGPVLALLLGVGGDWLLERWRMVALGVMVPTFYLWLADRTAIGFNIWWIAEDLTLGFNLFGLPLEEALFFLVTNIFVVFGMTLSLYPSAMERTKRLLKFARRQRPWEAVLGLWALSMVPTPLFPDAFPVLAYISTGLLALGVLGYAVQRYGPKALLLFAVVFSFGLGVEWLGKTTGLPFGVYRYTASGPSLFGVPLLVPLGWWAIGFISLSLTSPNTKPWLAPLALVAWDLGLDPLMVYKGFWQFEAQGLYYGVPLSNFVGWYVAGWLLIRLLLWLEPRLREEASPELRLVFLAQAFLISVGLVFFGMPLAGLLTFVAMSAFLLPQLRSLAPKARLQASK